jgi:hypothetical protein
VPNHIKMKIQLGLLFLMLFFVTSCQDENQKRQVETSKEAQKKALIYKTIESNWNFEANYTNAASKGLAELWPEWRVFINDLNEKPKSTLGAFQQKSKKLSDNVAKLTTTIPSAYNKPEIKSRISVLKTKINALDLYIHLDEIPTNKIILVIEEINIELTSLQAQFDEIVRKTTIPKEEGELDMIRMLDTTRAIPTPIK